MKLLYTDPYDVSKTIVEFDDYIGVAGGDGSLLTAIDMFYDLKKPFFGIAGGTVNFLMNEGSAPTKDATALPLKLIKVQVVTDKGSHIVWAFNDVAIGEFNAWIKFTTSHVDGQIGTFKGAALIVSTAQGSTGSNRNCQGSILPLNSYNWAVTNIWADRKVNCIVNPKGGLTIGCESRGNVKVAVDGTNHEFTGVSMVYLSQMSSVTLLINDIENLQQKRQ